MNYLELNLAALRQNIPDLYEKVVPLLDSEQVFEIKETPSGSPTAVYKGKLLHSAYNPVKEAEKTAALSLKGSETVCIVEGFALGYSVSAVLNRSGAITVIAVDNSLKRFAHALKARDMRDILLSDRVAFLIESGENSVSAVLRTSEPGEIAVIKNRNLTEIEDEYFSAVDNNIKRFTERKKVNTATLKKFGRIWIRNLIYNLCIFPEAESIDLLDNIFGSFPVLLLAAGPSLKEILPHIKQLQERFVTVAVDTAMKALSEAGVTPDFLVVIDPQYWNVRHLDRTDLSGTILVSESSTHPAVFRKGHKRLFFAASLFPLGQFIENFTGRKRRLGAGGSVSTSAWDLAHTLSRGPVYCSGLDLGFPDRETHYRGSFFEERVHHEAVRLSPAEDSAFRALNSAHPFYLENNTGGATLTDGRLIVYKQWFEERIEQSPERNTFNLSPKGIKIEGFTFTEPDSILDFPVIRDEINRIKAGIFPAGEKIRKDIRKNLRKGLAALADDLKRLSEITESCTGIIDYYNAGKIPLNEVLKTLDENDSMIVRLESTNISGFLIQSILQETVSDSTKENSLKMSRNLYNNIKESADYHLKLINLYEENC